MIKKGYSYHISLKQIRKYQKLTPKQKLEWLEEANRFSHLDFPEKPRKSAKLFDKDFFKQIRE